MLVTATVSRERAEEALLKFGMVKEEDDVIEQFNTDKIGGNDEIDFISRRINSQSGQGKIELDLDFIISDRATEILTTFLYFVRREDRSIIGW